MKLFSILLFTVLSLTTVYGQSTAASDSLDKTILEHFDRYTPELFRYSGLTSYGETKTTFDKTQIERELELLEEVKKSELLDSPTKSVFALCHNILIHSSGKGIEFLKLLNKPTSNEMKIGMLHTEFMFTKEYGEKLAVDNLESDDSEWSLIWARYLSNFAIYESSIPRIEKKFQQTTNTNMKEYLLNALMYISSPKSIDFIKQIIETTKTDEVQAKAIFVYAELTGYPGIDYLNDIKTLGEKSEKEKQGSIDWLEKSTSSKNKFGVEVINDIDFIKRFGDIKSPAMIYLDKEGLLEENKAANPTPLAKEKKDKIIDLLVESKAFGFEAVKGQLFLSLESSDIERLLTLRQMCIYSPNSYTQGRLNTIGIFVRFLRKTQK